MAQALGLSGRLLLAYVLVYVLIPAGAGKLPKPFERQLVPATTGKYTLANVAGSLLLYTAVIVGFASGPGSAGLVYRVDAVPIGLAGVGFMAMFVALFMVLLPGDAKAQAKSLGLHTPRDFVVHSTWYAFIWAGFREELFFRGLVQTKTVGLLGGTWGLLVPLLFFSLRHARNSSNWRLAAVWAASTLPGSLVFTLTYYFSGSLLAPVMAHGVNNCLAGVLTYLAVYKPAWSKPAALVTGAAGALVLFIFRHTVAALAGGLELALADGPGRGLLLLAILVGGTLMADKFRKRGDG